jgi:hypothetical protein
VFTIFKVTHALPVDADKFRETFLGYVGL